MAENKLIAIHHGKNSFSEIWVDYCKKNKIPYKIVNAYRNDIINQIQGCTAFLWHHNNYDYRDALFAKQLLYSLEKKGLKVFPNWDTTWHFDDKVGQKYLLEAINAPLVPAYVFYTKKEAQDWLKKVNFPIVFKLRGGSGSSNVKLVKNLRQAKSLSERAFGRGFSQFDRWNHLKFRLDNFWSGKESFMAVIKGMVRLLIGNQFSNRYPREKGYIYFQKFIPNNNYDTRIVVVGDKAAAERRFVRKNDFRASGSGKFSYDNINMEAVKIAFRIAELLGLQSVAFDFVIDSENKPLIVEISYGFGAAGISKVPGYWDKSLKWHEGSFTPQEWIIYNLISS